MINVVHYGSSYDVSSSSSSGFRQCNQDRALKYVVKFTTKPFGYKLMLHSYFCQGEVQSHIYRRMASRLLWLTDYASLMHQSIDTFLRRNSPLTTDRPICLSKSRSVSVLAVLQAPRRKPLLSCSRRSGLSANQMLSSPGRVRRWLPCGRSGVQCLVAQPMLLKSRLRRRKRDRTMASCERFSIYVLRRNVSCTSSAPQEPSPCSLLFSVVLGGDRSCEDWSPEAHT